MTELEQMIRFVNPTIDITDISHVKNDFDGCVHNVEYSFGVVL